jgi:hypothetical protein
MSQKNTVDQLLGLGPTLPCPIMIDPMAQG